MEDQETVVVQRAEVNQAGKNKANYSLIAGVIGLFIDLFFFFGLFGMIAGIVGLVFAGKSSDLGFVGTEKTAGRVCSGIAILIGLLEVVAVVMMVVFVGSVIGTVLAGVWS